MGSDGGLKLKAPVAIRGHVRNIFRLVGCRKTPASWCSRPAPNPIASFQSFLDDPTDKRCQTVGRVNPHIATKIIDQNGQIAPLGTQGELCVRGYSVMKGYWEDPDKTAESIVDGWMYTVT